MPPVNQGSRAGLITSVVVFVVLFITATIFAIYYNAELRKNEKQLADTRRQYEDISELTGPELTALRDARTDTANGYGANMKLLDVAVAQRNKLEQVITGKQGLPADTVVKQATAAGAAAARKLGDDVKLGSPGNNLLGSIDTLSSTVVAKDQQVKTLQQQLADLNTQLQAAVKQKNDAVAQMQKQVDDAAAKAQADVASAVTGRTSIQAQVDQIEAERKKERDQAVEAVSKKDQEIAAKQKEIDKIQKELAAVRAKLEPMRIRTDEPIIRQADGQINRVAGNGIVFIDRGLGDQITAGLTFEVYDRNEGVPSQKNTDQLPVGKGSIEVLRVGATSSECRIIREEPGQHLIEGDVIANLVYDPHTKYNFVVYGNFDLDQNEVATSQDADVIKRLITQWGAKVTDTVNVNTDFVVMGAEPQLPSFGPEDLKDPINRKKMDDAQAALDKYEAVKQQAIDLHIPVLNQNRFLYLIGYYDQSKR
jgi:hypothetical protein